MGERYIINQIKYISNADLSAIRGEWRITMDNVTKKFDFKTTDEEVTITEYRGTDTEVIIPSEIEGKRVTWIGDAAFRSCTGLTRWN